MIDASKVQGFVWYDAACGMVYYQDGKDVFAAWEGSAVDVTTGYLQGRWECSIGHWNRYAGSFHRPVIAQVEPPASL
jgi:hypothetical protein